jgi:hypothetical protein
MESSGQLPWMAQKLLNRPLPPQTLRAAARFRVRSLQEPMLSRHKRWGRLLIRD